jgi:Sulfatase
VVYFARLDPVRNVIVPVVALEALVTLGMLAAWEFCRRRGLTRHPAIHFLFLVLCLAPIGIAAVAVLRAAPFDLTSAVRARWFWPATFLAAIAPLIWILRRPVQASRLARGALLYSWPVLILVLAGAVRTSLRFPPSAYADGALAAPLPSPPPRTRVVWIIFDELSQTVAFGNRTPGLLLPNLDRLKAESFYATAAMAPANRTELSLPSLILGQEIAETYPGQPDNLGVKLRSGGGIVSWKSLPNVFDSTRELGFNTALVGWFHPYGRVLNRSLTRCYWTAGWLAPGVEEPSEPRPLVDGMRDRAGMQLVALPIAGHLPGISPDYYNVREKLDRFAWLNDRARAIVADPSIGLALIHLSIPHPPAIYDRRSGTFTSRGGSYLDNVALVDRTLGELRDAIEKAGLGDRTAILLSADHGFRTYLWRGTTLWTPEDENVSHRDVIGVPFLVKLPGRTPGVRYTKPFNTVVTREVITGILKGEITDSAAVAGLLTRAAQY